MKTAIIIGGAKTYAEDYKAAEAAGLTSGADIIVINDVGTIWEGNVAAWVSLHGEKMLDWMKVRDEKGLPAAKRTFTGLSAGDFEGVRRTLSDVVEAKFDGQDQGGSSGLFAAKVALVDLGYDRVILCGIPMTVEGGHFFEDKDWPSATSFWAGWKEAFPHLEGKAFSMSGWTKTLLGAPPEKGGKKKAAEPAPAA